MYRKLLGRRPKRRGESSSTSRFRTANFNSQENINLPVRLRNPTNVKEVDGSDISQQSVIQDQLSNKSAQYNQNQNIMLSPERHSFSTVMNDDEIQQQTGLPQSIQLNKSSSSISSITTSLFDLPAFNSTSDASSNNTSSYESNVNLDLSSEEKSRRLQLFSKNGDRSDRSAYNRKRRLIMKLKSTLKKLGNEDQGGVILEETLNEPEFKNLKKKARLISFDEHNFYTNVTNNLFKCVKQVSDKSSSRGRLTDTERIARDLLVTGVVPSPSNTPTQASQTLLETKKYLVQHSKVPESTARRILQVGSARKAILSDNSEDNKTWLALFRNRSHYKTMQRSLRDNLVKWILSHEHVVQSSLGSDTILVLNPVTKKREPVTKLLLQCSVRELHDDLIGPPPKGLPCVYDSKSKKLLVSESTLRAMLPPQLRRMTTAQKEICGCECCIATKLLHQALLHFRSNNRSLRSISHMDALLDAATNMQNDNSKVSHTRPNAIIKVITCPPMDNGKHHWKCILDRCTTCNTTNNSWHGLRNNISLLSNISHQIHFGVYKMHTRCKLHGMLNPGAKACMQCTDNALDKNGTIISKRELTKMQTPLHSFLTEHYFPQLNKYKYHIALVELLGKHETKLSRRNAFHERKSWFFTERDYAERLKKEVNNEIQSEHFGFHVSLSIEGATMAHHVKDDNTDSFSTHLDFHSHMSDDSPQDAATTHVHMCAMLDHYCTRYKSLPPNCVILDHTDGCAKQYRCGNALFFLSILAHKYKIIIDRAIAAPGHGKSIIDGLNAVDKTHLRQRMMISDPLRTTERSNIINVFNYTNTDVNSFAEDCARICASENRHNGVLTGSNYAARAKSAKLSERFYHVHNDNHNIPNIQPQTTNGWINNDGGKNGIRFHYNFRADPKLQIGQIAVRRIPCACDGCLEQLEQPWVPKVPFHNQPRYKGGNTKCVYWNIFEGLNDWLLITMNDKVSSDGTIDQSIVEDTLQCNTASVADEVSINAYCALATNDNNVKVGYYILQWKSLPYVLPEDISITTFKPPMMLKKGDMVCDAVFLNDVKHCKLVYTHGDEEALKTVVRLQHVVTANVEMIPITEKNDLPSKLSRIYRYIANKEAVMLSESTHELILEEIERRNNFDV